jgi:hypothetical protein
VHFSGAEAFSTLARADLTLRFSCLNGEKAG